MRDDAIGFLLKAGTSARDCAEVTAWWAGYRDIVRVWRNPMDRAIVAGFSADRVGWAFASGYQAALHALFPGAPEDRICALCVTEEDGNTPKVIKSLLSKSGRGWSLNGAKKWTTLGPDGALFFVAAKTGESQGRPEIRIVKAASGQPGLKIELMPPTKFVPEVAHARLRFENVAIADEAFLPGDGYEQYVRPFRTVEDLHVHGAILAYLVREARRLQWPQGWIERMLSVLFTMERLSSESPSSPSTHLALAGTFATSAALLKESEAYWKNAGADPAAARWERDRDLLKVAGGIREQRTKRAWERLTPVG